MNYSCTNDSTIPQKQYVYKKTTQIKKVDNSTNRNTEIGEGIYFEYKIVSSIPLNENMSITEIELEIEKNNAEIELEIEIYDDPSSNNKGNFSNSSFNTFKFANNPYENETFNDNFECSAAGIKQCAFAVYNTWSKAKIIYESLTGGAQNVVVECAARNCLGW